MSRRRLLLGGAALILMALLVSLVLSLNPRKVISDTGPSLEVLFNRWLAAEQFLAQQGIEVDRSNDMPGTLQRHAPAGHTLLLLADHNQLEEPAHQPLLDWVSRGGHLVMIARRDWDEDEASNGDWLLDRLGLQRIHLEDALPSKQSDRLTQLYLEGEALPAYLDLGSRHILQDPQGRASARAGNARGDQMLQLPWGNGLVTVLNARDQWDNNGIEKYDHAWLLWYLTQDSSVTLFNHFEVPGLLALLKRHFPMTLLAGALLLMLGLIHFGRRQGPLQLIEDIPPRSLAEHLGVAAAFIARRAGRQQLVRRLQLDVQQQFSQRHPGFERLPRNEQWKLLARLSGLPAEQVREALRPPKAGSPLNAARFTQQVIDLQRLRNAL